MKNSNLEFLDQANPHSWLLTADSLHAQALAIYHQRGQKMIRKYRPGEVGVWHDLAHKSVFLLGGFALENAIKAFLVYENPGWVANGRLGKRIRSHSLTKLQSRSTLIPYQKKYKYVLEGFEEGLESWARYPCALTVASTKEEAVLQDRIWAGYLRLMSAYGNKMIRLLAGGWEGPYGGYGRFKINKKFLDMCN